MLALRSFQGPDELPERYRQKRPRLTLVHPSDAIAGDAAVEAQAAARDREVLVLETQVQRLSEALSRALRLKQRALPAGIGDPSARYARNRWLVRPRWWPF